MNMHTVIKSPFLVAILSCALLFCGCDEDSPQPQGPVKSPLSANLLGLADGKTLDYIQIDSLVRWLPTFSIQVDTSTQVIRISGANTDWMISDNDSPLINLKVSEPFTLLNGFWRKVGGFDALVTFPEPAVVMNSETAVNGSWESTVPAFISDTGLFRFPFIYAYFGFNTRKTYSGTSELITPTFAGDAFRFDVELLANRGDSIPLATAIEYYAPNIGLIRWEFRGDGFTRVLILRNSF